jgi:hypothetical protein
VRQPQNLAPQIARDLIDQTDLHMMAVIIEIAGFEPAFLIRQQGRARLPARGHQLVIEHRLCGGPSIRRNREKIRRRLAARETCRHRARQALLVAVTVGKPAHLDFSATTTPTRSRS